MVVTESTYPWAVMVFKVGETVVVSFIPVYSQSSTELSLSLIFASHVHLSSV